MDLSQLEHAYIELGRVLLVNKMCQGEFPFNPNSGILFGKVHFSAATITWLVYDFCECIPMEL